MKHLAWLSFLVALAPSLLSAGEVPRSISVLFLGDQGHHRPTDRFAQLAPVMAVRGIELTYTENLDDLNPKTLARYDALFLYANIERIEPRQEQALLDYVASGGGFAPIHCASFCFQNSPEFVDLVGGQFLSHGTGEFETKVNDSSQPIMRGLEPFRTWDETYVHQRHNLKNRTVLQSRVEGDREAPWTWARTQGKGRVFYTAYGHDARTWGNPGFQDLIERGLRWVAGKGEVFDSRPRKLMNLKPFEHASAKIPLYLPGTQWGAQGEPLDRMQKPVRPDESMKHMLVPRGFEVRLFAAEPEIAKPICMAWDYRGRLWIAETTDYPNDRRPEGLGNDRIKICEDTNGDGRADKFTIFAEKLSIPTSLTFANGGVIVSQAPEMLFLKDTDGDDRADVRKVLFHGWGVNDTHAGPSNLRWGFDNWIWGIVGYAGFKGQVGGEALEFRQGFFRFKPDGSKLEFLRNTDNNSWGVGFSEEGLIFGSTANGNPSVYLPIPNRYYESVRGWSPTVLGPTAASDRFYAITDKVRQVDHFGRFTAAAGHALYTARAYPKPYWNRTAFVSEPTGHLTATFTLERLGSDFITYNGWNLLASDDEWTAPISAEVGPDGQVWVIDWYNYIVQHNPTPQGFETGKGAAYVTPLRDKTHGRIYRIVATGSKPYVPFALTPTDGPRLVATLKNDNLFWRLTAQRLLIEHGQRDVVPALIELTRDETVDEIGLNPGAIHAVWTLHGLGTLGNSQDEVSRAVVAALKHRSAGVRRNALQVLPRDAGATAQILSAGLLSDPDSHVRLAALLALAEMPPSDAAASALVSAILKGQEADRWLTDAATSAAAAHDGPFLKAIAVQHFSEPPGPQIAAIVRRVAEHHARGGPKDSVGSLIMTLAGADPRISAPVITGLAQGWPKDHPLKRDEEVDQALVLLLSKLADDAKGPLVSLAERWGSKGLARYSAEVAGSFLTSALDTTKSDAVRIASARRLVDFRKGEAEPIQTLLGLITPRTSPELTSGLLEAIGRSESPSVGTLLVETVPTLTPSIRAQVLRILLGRGDWTTALLDGVDRDKVALAELSLDQKQALAAHPNLAIAARAKRLLDHGGGLPDPDRQQVIEQLAKVVLRSGDPIKGKLIFQQQCTKCHKLNGEGNTIGPDLTGMASHPKIELLTHILDPSRSVEGNFVQYSVVTQEGRIFNGLLASETKTAIELVDTEGKKHVVLREEIDELVASKKSLMPEGFEKQVPAEGIADLLEFLTKRGKYMPLDLRRAATSVSTQGMFHSKDSEVERLIFADWSPKTFEGVPFLLVDPKDGRVPNVIMLYAPQGVFPPQMPKSVSLPCNSSAKAIHFLSGVSGWGYLGGPVTPTVSMIVRLHYAQGGPEDHVLKNGVEFADYIRPVDVPGSKPAFKLRGQQIRYLAVHPQRTATIERIELIKGPDPTAPIVMAVTVETSEPSGD